MCSKTTSGSTITGAARPLMVAPDKMEGLFLTLLGCRAVLISEQLCSPEETEGSAASFVLLLAASSRTLGTSEFQQDIGLFRASCGNRSGNHLVTFWICLKTVISWNFGLLILAVNYLRRAIFLHLLLLLYMSIYTSDVFSLARKRITKAPNLTSWWWNLISITKLLCLMCSGT